MDANKVRFGLNNVHYAIITGYDEDDLPIYDTPKRFKGAVNLSLDPSGETSNFYADNGIYYVLKSTSGFEGDLEMAFITDEVAVDLLGDVYDSNGLLVEATTAEVVHFALMFEFEGDKNKIKHCILDCTASRSTLEGSTLEENKEVQTETLSITAAPLANGVVKYRTSATTTDTQYKNFYNEIVIPTTGTSQQVDTPKIVPGSGSYEDHVYVTILSTGGATTYYTTDGSDPATSSTRKSFITKQETITIDETSTVKAYAAQTGYTDSKLATGVYTITSST